VSPNAEQAEHWNSDESRHWVEHAQRYDSQLAPFGDALLDAMAISAGEYVLDVGCGCGATTIAAATKGAESVTGVDLSRPMLALATERARAAGFDNVEFIEADAQNRAFEPASFDVVLSRFGVMFFDDPTAAFANLNGAMRRGGRVGFVSWRPLDANPWLLVPGLAAAAHVAFPDLGGDGSPGMFSFASADAIRPVLSDAGFAHVEIEPLDPEIALGGGGSLDDSVEFLVGTGIARALFESATPDQRARAIDAVREALGEYYDPDRGVCLGSGAWLVTASA
jgi:SAM-dependent methyltransferase